MRRLLWLLAALLVLAGCTVGSSLVVNPDGSGTYATTLTADGTAGNSLYKAVVNASKASGVPMTITHYSSGGETGVTLTFGFKSLQDFSAISAKLGAATGTGLAGVTFSRGTAGWNFTANVPGGFTRSPSDSQTGSPGGAIDPAKLGALVHMSVAVTLPGSPGTNNATAVTHTPTTTHFEWSLPVGRTAGALTASTAFVGNQGSVPLATALTALGGSGHGPHSGSSHTALIVGLVVGAAVIVAIGALLLLRRRRSAAAAASAGGEPISVGPAHAAPDGDAASGDDASS